MTEDERINSAQVLVLGFTVEDDEIMLTVLLKSFPDTDDERLSSTPALVLAFRVEGDGAMLTVLL